MSSAIILSTHDEAAAAPLVKQAVDKGIAVIIVNSDIADFPDARARRRRLFAAQPARTSSASISSAS